MATTFTNPATLSFNGTSVQSNVAVGSIESALQITKQTSTETYAVGDSITYIIAITNSSETAFTDLTVTDDLGAYVFNTGEVQPLTYEESSVQYFLDGMLQPDPTVSTASGVAFSGITVPADGNTVIVYRTTVNDFAPLGEGAEITNTATLTGNTICDAEATATVTANDGALLSMLKSVTPVPVAENGELTYTFRMENNGATALETADNATVTDTFNPILSDLVVTLNGAPLAVGTDYTYDEATGEFSTVAGVLTVPAAECTQDPTTGAWSVTPGVSTLIVSGTVGRYCDVTERS